MGCFFQILDIHKSVLLKWNLLKANSILEYIAETSLCLHIVRMSMLSVSSAKRNSSRLLSHRVLEEECVCVETILLDDNFLMTKIIIVNKFEEVGSKNKHK